MSRPSITLGMIVKDEADNLPRIFESVKDCFDEIHITDTGSKDGTQDVARKLGAQVFDFTWCDDFSAARNHSFSNVKTDFVAWLDGDDVLENRENFIKFRDDIMKIADYWVAPYHYASDAEGKSTCTFARERVFRMSRQPRWRYFIHEGVTPDGPVPWKIQLINSWAIRHKRTEEDLKKDRSRNIQIFERKLKDGPLDARMRYYYAKELFEHGLHKEAIAAFQSANADPTLEMHDRILGLQFLCFAYIDNNEWNKAIEFAHAGLMLEPNRAEFHCILADCYVKSGQLHKAVPYFSAAKTCYRPAANSLQPIFLNEDAYTTYPRDQLARVYFHLGEQEKARAEVVSSIEIKPSTENRSLLMEIDRITGQIGNYKHAKPCEDIVFTTPPQHAYPFDPEIASQKAMGGSETAMIEMAYWLRRLTGRPVKVFSQRPDDRVFDGVEYIQNTKMMDYMAVHKPAVLINWRHNIKVSDAPTLLWAHDLTTQGADNYKVYDKFLALTPFHKTFTQSMMPIPDEKIWITRNGLNPEKFKTDKIIRREPFRFVFSSSPDRGLDRAMRVLDKVRVKYPEVKLHVAYGIEHLSKWGHEALQKELAQMMADRKDWVVYEGALEQRALMELFYSCAYTIAPADWIETSCISALERACAGVYQIFRKVGGVVDTLAPIVEAGMATTVDSECVTESEHQVFVDATIKAIEEEAYKRVNVEVHQYAWSKVAEEWVSDLFPAIGVNIPLLKSEAA